MRTEGFEAVPHPTLVPFDGSFRVADAATAPPREDADRGEDRRGLRKLVRRLDELQRTLYADDRWSVLLVFQAMDAAGKDSTIRAVLTGVNPAGFQIRSFGVPSSEELDHEFLWRVNRALPERGRIGVFNRSHYEEVLVARVHPELLDAQRLPRRPGRRRLWEERFDSIREFEKHLARNGTALVKFWLHVSRREQLRRFVSRVEEPEKNWKFSVADFEERDRWDEYMEAYEAALAATSRPWAPWYAIPADDKPYMRRCVAEIVVRTLEGLDLRWPELDPEEGVQLRRLAGKLRRGK